MRRTRLSSKRLANIDEEEQQNLNKSTVKKTRSVKKVKKGSFENNVDKVVSINKDDSISAQTNAYKVTKELVDLESSSDSDLENYLKPANEIDLNSSFFQNKSDEKSFEAIENDIFEGTNRLSDSESENEAQTEKEPVTFNSKIISASEKLEEQKPTASKINFRQLHDYTKKLEEAKQLIKKYEARKEKQVKLQNLTNEECEDNIQNLLSKGEKADLTTPNILRNSLHSSDFETCSESEKEDWEEVEENESCEIKSIVPKEGVQITVQLPGAMHQKKGVDLIAMMKRRLNKIKKENQIYVHKVHLLCWLAHGNYVNKILNNENVLALALSLIPSQHCYPSDRTDLNYLTQIVDWYRMSVPILVEKPRPKHIPLDKYLSIQLTCKQAYSKKMAVYIFICILRSLGIQCRLVLSFRVAPIRPLVSELHSLSTKIDMIKEKQTKSTLKHQANSKKEATPKKEVAITKKGTTKKEVLSKSEVSTKEEKNSNSNKEKKVKLQNLKLCKLKETEVKKLQMEDKLIENTSKKSQLKNTVEKSRPENRVNTKDKKQRGKSKDKRSTNASSLNNSSNSKGSLKSPPKKIRKSNNKHYEKVPQIDGANDSSDDEPSNSQKTYKINFKKLSLENSDQCSIKKHPKRLKSLPNYTEKDSDDDFKPNKEDLKVTKKQHSIGDFTKPSSTHSKKTTKVSLKKLKTETNKIPVEKLKEAGVRKSSITPPENHLKTIYKKPGNPLKSGIDKSHHFSNPSTSSNRGDIRNDIISIMKGRLAEERAIEKQKLVKGHRRIKKSDSDYDSDYAPAPIKKKYHDSDDEFHEKNKVKVKQRLKVKQEAEENEIKEKKGVDVWVEIFLEAEEKWISADIIRGGVHCVNELHSRASHPISYIITWNNDNSIKDITQRYCPNWNTVTRKLRIDKKWWDATLKPFMGRKTARDKEEDEELARLQLEKPLPTTISEYKNHPLYVLKRHLLKFEAIYPSDAVTLGFVRNEPVYSRDCVHTLHSREIWVKHAKVVKPGEKPYKIVKARPKYDKLSGQVITDLPLEIFGEWQIEDYIPPIAKDGIVPRNAYGNVELFKACMLPKGTVHLHLPGLNKLAKRMNIDCAPAVVGFDFHAGGSHPTFDGFVVCEEHSESLIAAWYMEQEEQEKREQEKIEKRVYGNWKRLIKGLLIRERLKARYDYGLPSKAETSGKKRKSKGSRLVSKKCKIYSSDSDAEGI